MKRSSLYSIHLLYLIILAHTISLGAAEQPPSLTSQLTQPKVLVPVGIGLACSAAVVTRWIYKKRPQAALQRSQMHENPAGNPAPRNRAREERPSPIQLGWEAAVQAREAPHDPPAQRHLLHQKKDASTQMEVQRVRRDRSIATSDNGTIAECLQPLASRLLEEDHARRAREKRELRKKRRQRQRLRTDLQTIQRELSKLPEEQIQVAQMLRDTLIFKGLRHVALLQLPQADPENTEEVRTRALQEKTITDMMDTLEKAGTQKTIMAARSLFHQDLKPLHQLAIELATKEDQLSNLIRIVSLFAPRQAPSGHRNESDEDTDDSDDDEDADDERDDNEEAPLPAVRADSDFDGATTSSEREQDQINKKDT